MTNFFELDRAITHAVEHPEQFSMNDWLRVSRCGTTACLAGTAALLNGWKPERPDWQGNFSAVLHPSLGVVRDVETLGRDILGLTDEQASDVFYVESIAEVIKLRNQWAQEEGLPVRIWLTPVLMLNFDNLTEAEQEAEKIPIGA